jgi:hypothetical protein
MTCNFVSPCPLTVLGEDLADLDVLRVNDTFYLSASTMHFSPGAPVLRSPDLVHWEYIGHSVPTLDWGPQYDLAGGRAYNKGIWASFFNRRRDGAWLWGGCIEGKRTHIYEAPAPQGPWKRIATLPKCYYDCGLLVTDDGALYVAYGAAKITVAQLSPDARREVRTKQSICAAGRVQGHDRGEQVLQARRVVLHPGHATARRRVRAQVQERVGAVRDEAARRSDSVADREERGAASGGIGGGG